MINMINKRVLLRMFPIREAVNGCVEIDVCLLITDIVAVMMISISLPDELTVYVGQSLL